VHPVVLSWLPLVGVNVATFRARSGVAPALAVVIAVAFGVGCGTTVKSLQTSYSFFRKADPDTDPWYWKVREWQSRAHSQRSTMSMARRTHRPTVPEGPVEKELLRTKVHAFRAYERRTLAAHITKWSRLTGRKHYDHDASTKPTDDQWPTHWELLATDGDDCDGLDLIAYELLRDFGFPLDELFRGVVRRDRDGVNHMVTLWFEDPDDPWVLDVTGAMTMRMRKFSELRGWTPTVIFNETAQFTVRPRGRDKAQ
jgi:predicted transglutaminase-like cysteine proteinase